MKLKSLKPSSQPLQFPHPDLARLCRDQIPQCIGGIVAAHAFLIGIHFQHVLGPVRIVLQAGQTFQEPRTAAMDEQAGSNARIRIAQAMEDLGPAIDAIGVRGAWSQSENSAGSCFWGKGWMGRRDEGEYHSWVFD